MKEKTPQEKKALSYAKDRRNTYGQNDKASRNSIPKRKAEVNRSYRKKISDTLKAVVGPIDIEIADKVDDQTRSVRRGEWKKCSDTPRGEVVERKLEHRENHAGNGKAARKKTTEFLKTLKIDTEQETDGRWIAKATNMNGVMAYGDTKEDAIFRCLSLARIVYMGKLGACEILSVDEIHISILSK